ncbi:AraC family transcriptional regulator [Haloferula sp.]|uniref:AraC family transcriptional regulator n=1 Tax=Haloferula sp. TaxID=2497595 RepID=UPI00329B3B88
MTERRKIQGDLHRHEYIEMMFVCRGNLTNRFVDSEISLKPGDLVVLKPYVNHVLELGKDKKPILAFCCSFLPEVVDSGIRSLDEAAHAHPGHRHLFTPFLSLVKEDVSAVRLKLSKPDREEVAIQLEELRALSQDPDASACAQIRCRFLSLLAFLSDHCESLSQPSAQIQAGSAAPAARFRPKLQKTLNYIHNHADEPLVLKDMASMCGTSPTYFCQLFKHETGMTFLQYLNDLRIQNACSLLRESGDNIAEICYRSGFNDYSHFSRLFKKHVGVSAAEFRKTAR